MNGWEIWEPKDKSKKDAVRTYWSLEEEESGISMWNKEGLAFYYTVEKNWKEVYNDKEQFSVLMNGWRFGTPMTRARRMP